MVTKLFANKSVGFSCYIHNADIGSKSLIGSLLVSAYAQSWTMETPRARTQPLAEVRSLTIALASSLRGWHFLNHLKTTIGAAS